jgi:hypothetical protein
MVDPLDVFTLEVILFAAAKPISPSIAYLTNFKAAFDRFHGTGKSERHHILNRMRERANGSNDDDVEPSATSVTRRLCVTERGSGSRALERRDES